MMATRRLGMVLASPQPMVVALLALLLQATATQSALLAGWLGIDGSIALVATAACFEYLLLAAARVPRWVPLVLAVPLCALVVVPVTAAAAPAGVPLGTAYLRAIPNGFTDADRWSFEVLLAIAFWAGAAWLGWWALGERRGLVAAIPAFAWLAVDFLNADSPGNLTGIVLAGTALSLMLIAATTLEGLGAAAWRLRVSALPGTGSRFSGMAIAAVAGLIALGLFLPPLTTTDLSGRLFGKPHAPPGPGGSSSSVPGAVGSVQFNSSTNPGGSLVSHPIPALRYTSDAGGTYLAIAYDSDFNRGDWFVASTQAPHHFSFGVSAGDLPVDHSAGAGGPLQARRTVNATVTVLAAGATGDPPQAVFPGEPVSTSVGGVLSGFGTPQGGGQGLFVTVDGLQLAKTAAPSVQTAGEVSDATADQLRAAGTSYPLWVTGGLDPVTGDTYPGFLALPDDGSNSIATIRALAQQWAGSSNPYDAATAIETHLRSEYHYTLTPPSPPSGVWPLVFFLTQSKQGYCQYYASAMGTMLRSLGIPARLVNGYGPGHPLGGAGAQSPYQVNSSDAHTWVEAWFPHYGWVTFEPTPPSNEGDYVPFPRGGTTTATPTPGASETATPRATATPRPTATASSGAGTVTPSAGPPAAFSVGLPVAGAVLLVIATLIVWLARPRDLTAVWRRVRWFGGAAGVPPQPGDTHLGYARRLEAAFSLPGWQQGTAADVATLATLAGAGEFSREGLGSKEVILARHIWHRMLRRLPAVLVWSMRSRPLRAQTRLPVP